MNSKVQKVLEKIENNGFEAYVIGGFVRDHLLGIKTYDVDICTNALPKDIIALFEDATPANYGSVAFKIGQYDFDITTYRAEDAYENRKPVEVEYVNDLILDLKRRDFTINTICMSSSGGIVDLLNGREDIFNKRIKVVGDVTTKLTEDPLRVLRAIRFSVILDFDIDEEIINMYGFTGCRADAGKISSVEEPVNNR